MSEKGMQAEGVVEVVSGERAQAMVAELRMSRSEDCWIELKNGETRRMRDFRDGDRLKFREHIQHTESSPRGLVVFLCLEDETGAAVRDSLMSMAEITEHEASALVPVG